MSAGRLSAVSGRATHSGRLSLPLPYRFILPLFVVLGVILVYPLIYSLWVSLHDSRLTAIGQERFVGIGNYVSLRSNRSYWVATANTLTFVVGAVGLELLLGFALALLLYRPLPFRDVFRAVLLTPMFITPIAVGLMFRFLLDSQLGLVPHLLRQLGVHINWFGPNMALFSLILIDAWQWTPMMILLLLAGLESLPVEPFEAARVEGASWWATLRLITIPLMRPAMLAAITVRMLDAFKVFEYVYAITRGGPGERTEVIQYHIYRVGFLYFRMGEAAAMAYTLVGVTLLLVVALYYAWRAERV